MQGSKTTIGELIKELTTLLTPISPDIAHSEAITILETLLDLSRSQLFLNSHTTVDSQIVAQSIAACRKRLTGMPLAYSLGSQYFYSKEFWVSSHTLIPRPDTETLIVTVLEKEPSHEQLRLLELGTGTGIIPEVLTSENPTWSAVSVDFSTEALQTARRNCGERVQLINGDRFEAIKREHQFDCIVSNPPYIPTAVVENDLEPCVINYEPLSALDGGEDGLTFYRYLATEGPGFLTPQGRIYLEIGYDQGSSVPALFAKAGWKEITVIKDLGNRDRVVTARLV